MKRKSYYVLITFIIGLVFSLSGVSTLFAQETKAEEFTLEEITVTAQKRVENQQKVAIAMDVISSDEIKELGKNNIDEILSGVSSAIIQKAADGYRVSLRGISDDSSASMGQSMAAPSVAINTDGVYSNRKDTGSGLFDIERVEVLYGPQSTMYSSNSPGGIVNVVTAAPKIDKYEVSAALTGGNYSLIKTEGAVNVPVGSQVAIRASISTSKRDGYLTGGGDAENTKSGRLRMLYQPTDKLSFTLTGEMSKNTGATQGGGVVVFDKQDDVDNPWTAATNESQNSNDQKSKKVFVNMNWDMGSIGTLTFIPSYSTRNGSNSINMMGEVWNGSQRAREKSAEIRIASASDFFFKWIFGATYYKSMDHQLMVSDAYLASGNGTFSDRKNTENNKALFLNVTYPVMDTFRLTAGLRSSWDEMVTKNDEYKPEGGAYVWKHENPTQNTNAARPDYKVGFEYDLNTSAMLYGDYATSYRVQAMSSSSDPQELKAYSVGSKNRLFGNKLQLNASAYYYDYSNYSTNYRENIWYRDYNGDNQQPSSMGPPGPPDPNVQQEVITDDGSQGVTGEGHMFGVDLSASALITSEDMVTFSLSYIKSEWTDLYFHWEYADQTKLVNGVATIVSHPDVDYSGKPMTNTPPWTINLNYSHNFNLWNGGALKAAINAKYMTGYSLAWQEDYLPNCYQETHYMAGANLGYSDPSGKWSLSAYVTNMFNYAEKRNYMNAGGNEMMQIGDPRTYGAVLSVKF
jgi:iron complex outermembrane recepter protein